MMMRVAALLCACLVFFPVTAAEAQRSSRAQQRVLRRQQPRQQHQARMKQRPSFWQRHGIRAQFRALGFGGRGFLYNNYVKPFGLDTGLRGALRHNFTTPLGFGGRGFFRENYIKPFGLDKGLRGALRHNFATPLGFGGAGFLFNQRNAMGSGTLSPTYNSREALERRRAYRRTRHRRRPLRRSLRGPILNPLDVNQTLRVLESRAPTLLASRSAPAPLGHTALRRGISLAPAL
jgi:hypothetical protein